MSVNSLHSSRKYPSVKVHKYIKTYELQCRRDPFFRVLWSEVNETIIQGGMHS